MLYQVNHNHKKQSRAEQNKNELDHNKGSSNGSSVKKTPSKIVEKSKPSLSKQLCP